MRREDETNAWNTYCSRLSHKEFYLLVSYVKNNAFPTIIFTGIEPSRARR